MKRSRGLSILIFGIILVSAILLPGEVKAKAPDVVTIKVGGLLTISGPGAQWQEGPGKAEMIFFKHINKKGGIEYTEPDGTKHRFIIEHKFEDVAYDSKKTITSYTRLRDWGAHLLTAYGTNPGGAVIAPCARDHVPVMLMVTCHPDPRSYVENLDAQYALPNLATNVDATFMMLSSIKRGVWAKAHPAGEPMKAGVIAFDNPPRRLYKEKAVKDLYAKGGIDLVGAELVPVTLTDATVQLKRLYDAGARAIQIDHTISGSKVVLEDAERLGIKDKVLFVNWYAPFRDVVPLSKLLDGTYNPSINPTYHTAKRSPEIEKVAKIYLEEDPAYWEYLVDWAIHTHHELQLAIQAIKAALEKYGYEGFTRERLRNAMFNLREVETAFYPKFSIDPKYPLTGPYLWMYQIDGKTKSQHEIGPGMAPGPGLFQQEWNPSDDPKKVLTNYYKWP